MGKYTTYYCQFWVIVDFGRDMSPEHVSETLAHKCACTRVCERRERECVCVWDARVTAYHSSISAFQAMFLGWCGIHFTTHILSLWTRTPVGREYYYYIWTRNRVVMTRQIYIFRGISPVSTVFVISRCCSLICLISLCCVSNIEKDGSIEMCLLSHTHFESSAWETHSATIDCPNKKAKNILGK